MSAQPSLSRPRPPSLPLDHLAERGMAGAPALLLGDRTIDHAGLRSGVGRLAGWLAARQLAPGARVASWLAKGELACLLPLACARAGLVHVPINPLLKRAQAAHILRDSGAAVVIANAARLASLSGGDIAGVRAYVEADVAVAAADAQFLGPSAADPDSLAALLYTSGSSGAPKGVMLSHANLWLGAESVATFLALTPADRVLGVLPLAFDYGQNQLLSAWYAGASVAPLDYLAPADVVRAVQRHRLTTIAGVPALWHQLLDADWPEAALGTPRRLTNSGGALGAGLVRRLRARFPRADLYAMYGLTEAFRSTYLAPRLIDAHPTAVGAAVPHAEVLVCRGDGTLCAPDEPGEIVHCGPLVAQGYWRDPARSALRFRPAPPASAYGGTAVWSGDRGAYDAAGLLHWRGRDDALIKSGGYRISPEEVEAAVLASGMVEEVAALGLPDDRLGEVVHLVVRGDEARGADLAAHLSRALPNYMQPRAIHWRQDWPLTANGKRDIASLRRQLAGGQA